MEYVIMSLEEAKKVVKKDAVVLVSKQDLENPDCNIRFTKAKFGECHNILEEAATIAKVCDDFANQLRIFSKRQDIFNISPVGKLSTIMFESNKTDW